jgi:hypothetical protein
VSDPIVDAIDHFGPRNLDAEAPSNDPRIVEGGGYSRKRINRELVVSMEKPEDIPGRHLCGGIHLNRTAARGREDAITKPDCEIGRTVIAPAINDDDFCVRCSVPKMAQERPNLRRFV